LTDLKQNKLQIGVIGDSILRSEHQYEIAYEVGREIAKSGSILICGGRGGIMEAAAKGVKECNGISVGILPTDKADKYVNPYLTVIIPTFLHWGRNPLVPLASDGVIAIGGSSGTLTELAYSDLYNKPIVCITSIPGWSQEVGERGSLKSPLGEKKILTANTGKEAVSILINILLSPK
jgi:uncharacterized protein (TIGR00725 family)